MSVKAEQSRHADPQAEPDRVTPLPAFGPTGASATDRRAGRPPVSAIITCFDEREHIEDCIRSIAWCDEIIVVDSFSTDGTPELATKFEKVRLFQREYYGGASQKNWALQHASHEWVLILDSDERCTPALRQEIEALLAAGPTHDAYTLARRAFFLGKVIRFSGWRHDRVIRLFRRGCGFYQNRRVHAKLVTVGSAPLLRNPLEHHMVDSIEEYSRRLGRYAFWGAAQNWLDRRQTYFAEILLRPTWRFLRTYLAQGGILDGRRGLLFCAMQAYATYLKLSILWNWQLDAARGIQPTLPAMDDDQSTWVGLQRLESDAGRSRTAQSR